MSRKRSKLRMQTRSDHRHWPSISVVGWIGDELVIQRELPGINRQTVIDLQDFLSPRMRERPISYQSAISACSEISLVHVRYRIEDSGKSQIVIGPAPELSRQGGAAGQSGVGIGKCIGFKLARGVACARKEPDAGQNLLLQIGGNSGFAGVRSRSRNVRWTAGQRGELYSVCKAPHSRTSQIARHRNLAGLTPKLVATFDLAHHLKLTEGWV